MQERTAIQGDQAERPTETLLADREPARNSGSADAANVAVEKIAKAVGAARGPAREREKMW